MDILQEIESGRILLWCSAEEKTSFFICLSSIEYWDNDDEELGCYFLMMNRDGKIYWYNKKSVSRGKLI